MANVSPDAMFVPTVGSPVCTCVVVVVVDAGGTVVVVVAEIESELFGGVVVVVMTGTFCCDVGKDVGVAGD